MQKYQELLLKNTWLLYQVLHCQSKEACFFKGGKYGKHSREFELKINYVAEIIVYKWGKHLGTSSQVQGWVRGVLFDISNRSIYQQILNRSVKTKVPNHIVSLTRNCAVKIPSGRSTAPTKFHFRLTLSTNILSSKNPTCYYRVNAKCWTKQLRKKPKEFRSFIQTANDYHTSSLWHHNL